LAAVLRKRLQAERHDVFQYFCSPHHRDTPFFLIINQLERGARFERDDTPEAKLDKLRALLAPVAPSDEDIGLIAELLSLPCSGRYRVPDLMRPRRKKENTLEALVRYPAGFARRQPVLMIFEDLHWADATSQEFLDLLVDRIEGMCVLLVATLRSEFHPPWTGLRQVISLTLARLDQGPCTTIVEQIAGPKASLSSEIVAEIVERTDGVPLFLEELTKAIIENAAIGPIPAISLAVPATLRASLIARLDRLGPIAKEVAQVGAAAIEMLAEALAAAKACGADWADAELHRLRGELLQGQSLPDWAEIERAFRTSLAVAHEQGTRGFELRAAISLARLLSNLERRDEARDVLAPLYGWFTEGFDTPDLKEAKALLDELNT